MNNPDKVVLLFGNHDLHYIIAESYSRYDYHNAKEIAEVLEAGITADLFEVAFIHDKYLFTHAGLTKTWAKNILGNENPQGEEFTKALREYLTVSPEVYGFTTPTDKFPSNTGDDITQGPMWVRPFSLGMDRTEAYTHIIGHTQTDYIKLSDAQDHGFIMIDTMGYNRDYLIIENGKINKDYIE